MAKCLVYFRDGDRDHIVALEVDGDVCADTPSEGVLIDFDAARATRARRRRASDTYPPRRRRV